jgi:glutamate-1-semialdehyde 2,1-aminomutase
MFAQYGKQIAAVILEPVVGNMGCVPPRVGFLEGLRKVTEAHGALLIFDEVMTGFRIAYGGAQERFGVRPDLTTLGKVIGGGLPVGAYGGRRDIMDHVAPVGPVYQAGTLSGNPLAVTAGIATLKILKRPGTYEALEQKSRLLSEGMLQTARQAGVAATGNRVGSMFTLFFTNEPVVDWPTAKTSNTELFAAFFRSMLQNGVYLAPSQFEAGFLSTAHTESDVDATLAAARKAFAQAASRGA